MADSIMKATCVGLSMLLLALWSITAPAVSHAANQKLFPGTSYRVETNSQSSVSTNLDEIWPAVWKESTNGLRIQLDAFRNTDTKEDWLIIGVGSVVFDSGGSFFGPPSGKFAKFELRDTNGVILPPKGGVLMEGQFPERIPLKDLPRRPYGDRGLLNRLFFFTNSGPGRLREMKFKDIYRVPKEGEYTLTVDVVIYRFETNWHYLDRLDLPCITTKVHLTP
jgi:hypothetical protein